MHFKVCLLLLIAKLILCVNCELINTKVLRNIKLEGQFVKIDNRITVQNSGLNPINEYIYIIDRYVDEFYIKFHLNNEKIVCKNQTRHEFKVFLPKTLLHNKTFDFEVEVIYIGQIIPLQKTILYNENQFVLYNGNYLYYSRYETLLSKTIYNLKNGDIELSVNPQDWNANNLTYTFKNLQAFSFKDVKMVYEDNNPFFVVTNLERIIDVSHFGQICIQDRVSIKNAGSKLVGPYMNSVSPFVVQASDWWYTHLPASVEYVEYYDTIGNNSNSILLYFKNHTTFKFRPRYPLLSGWKTFYVINYCVPTYEYLYHDLNGYFVLKIRSVDHILNDVVIKKALVKILLPEAAKIVKVNVPLGFERLENEKLFTGLTNFGRPTVVVNGSNILENHIAYLEIEYLFPLEYLFRAPLVLIVYLKSIFLFFILVMHIKW